MDVKIRACLVLGLVLPALAGGCKGFAAGEGEGPVFRSYREVPGITAEEEAAVEGLRAAGRVFSYGALFSTECFPEDEGVAGYGALFCGWLSELFGIPFNPVICEWGELAGGLESGELDFTGEFFPTAERAERCFMSAPVARRPVRLMFLPGKDPLPVIARSRPLRYGFLQGSAISGMAAPFLPEGFLAVFAGSTELLYRMLEAEELDAVLIDAPAEAALDRYGELRGEDFIPLLSIPVSLSTRKGELAPLISVVDKALEAGASEYLARLYNRGYGEYLRYKFFNRLSPEEGRFVRDRLEGGEPVPVAMEYDNYPVCFYNHKEGAWQGIAPDILDQAGRISGLSFKAVNREGVEWKDLLPLLDRGEAAMITELIPTGERQGSYLWPEFPFYTGYYALLSRNDREYLDLNQVAYARIGLLSGTAPAEVFRGWFPGHRNLREFANTEAAFNALERGEIDLFMASRGLLLSVTNYLERPDFKENLIFSRGYGIYFGFNREERILCSVIGKAQALIDTRGIADSWNRRVFNYRDKLAASRISSLVVISFLLFVVLLLFLSLFIKKQKLERRLEATVYRRTRELEVQTAAAAAASRAKGDFLARMSHEIRTPLNAITGMTEIARRALAGEDGGFPGTGSSPGEGTPSPGIAKAAASLDQISTASAHLLGLINDILDMSKIESGKFTLVSGPFTLEAVLKEVTQLIEPRCREKGIRFVTLFEALPETAVMGDKLRLKQVLINLLGNAVKFTPEGGRVSLELKLISQGEREYYLSFSVADTGIGMNGAQVEKLFAPFEQTDNNIALRFGGTGLGLAISQNLVGLMGGQIRVRSREGKGTVFSFTIGLEPAGPEDTPPEESARQGPPDLRGKRILLVEDVEINRLILRELLANTGLQIDEAADGIEALERFTQAAVHHYGLIFMDVQMPRQDGYETTRRIRALPRADAASIPIIAMTANAYREDIDRALQSGMNAHLAKPIDINQVLQVLRDRLL